jgi:predicted nuclease of restriction endonuclease-like RecB superfamily
MLPSNLLRARISGGRIRPLYVGIDSDTTALAETITDLYRNGIGKRKGELLERMKALEDEGTDFKLVRGLSTLLERRATFEADTDLNPVEVRKAVFKEASKVRPSSPEERERVLKDSAMKLGLSPDALEKTLFSDIEDELILREFNPFPSAEVFLKYYNLAVTQTLLFKSLRVEFSASGNWKNIFRDVKRLGLIYSAERDDGGGGGGEDGRFKVSLDGPLSLFKMTERYGTSIAKLLPQIMASDSWTIKAEILSRRRGGKVYSFEADSRELKDIVTNVGRGVVSNDREGDLLQRPKPPTYDSTTEERFARSFLSFGTGWTLRREPEPLIAGTHVLIPDFCFEKDGMKVYLEVVGFWTPEYLARKIEKLGSIAGVDMIIAADENLACSKLDRLKGKALVIYYKREVPLKPIIEHLRAKEGSIVSKQVEKLRGEGTITLRGDVISIDEIASQKGVAVTSMRIALQDFKPEAYLRVGGLLISRRKLDEIDGKLSGIGRLTDALKIVEACGVKEEGERVLEALGYTSTWEGMEMDKVRISKDKASTKTTS